MKGSVMTTKFNLTINPLTVVLLIGFIVCLVIIFRSCQYDPGEEIGRLKGEVEARDEQLEIKEQGLQELREKNDALQAEKDGAIDSSNTVIDRLQVESDLKSQAIERLEIEFDKLSDKDAKIENLQAQVVAWESRFSLAQETIAEKDAKIFSLQDKYESELELRQSTEIVLEDYRKSIAVRDELVSELERKLKSKSRWQTLERLAFVGVAGLLLYNSLS